jgi:hypothetical protein
MTRAPVFAFLAFALAGCCRERVVVRPEPVEVVREVRAPIPGDLLRPSGLVEPDGACWRDGKRVLCNRQLAEGLLECRVALASCDADKAALRALGGDQ